MRRREGRRDRRHRRYDVDGVAGSLRYTVGVRILDISAGGMQVTTAQRLEVGRHYRFTLQTEGARLDLMGGIMWCVLSDTTKVGDDEFEPTYTAGIAFENTLSDEGNALIEFLESKVILQVEHRLFGRFQVADADSAIAGMDFDFVVKRLSLSGMLIESDFVPLLEATFTMDLHLGEEAVSALGRVAYVKQLGDDQRTAEIGVEFLELDEEQREILRGFIDREFTAEDPEVAES